jgi:serine/threonine protein kinase
MAVKAFSKAASFAENKGEDALINEITLMRKLNHKNLIKLYEVYETSNSIYMC